MKKKVKIALIIIGAIVGLIILDTIQARILKHSPIISWKENSEIKGSYVDRGVLIDTYYCANEKNVDVSWHLKTSDFNCFKVTVDGGTSNGKINHNLIKTNINNEYNLYYFEIDNAVYLDNGVEIELKDALADKKTTIEEIVSKMEENKDSYGGGTIIYKNKDLFKDDIEIVKCKTAEGIKDVYVGLSGMGYRNNFCLSDNKTYTRTYTVKSVEDNKINNFMKSLKVLLSDGKKEEYVILNDLNENIEVNKTYEFELLLRKDALINDSIESVFNNCMIVGVKETDKSGSNQINDLIK